MNTKPIPEKIAKLRRSYRVAEMEVERVVGLTLAESPAPAGKRHSDAGKNYAGDCKNFDRGQSTANDADIGAFTDRDHISVHRRCDDKPAAETGSADLVSVNCK
ncbi:MAG TPA: hypothetical protein ACFCUC_04075 [Desulfobacterales bacterium]